MIKSCDLLVLTLVYLAHHIVVSALGHRSAPLALAAFNFDQSSRPSSDGKRQLREKDIVRDARDEERGVSSFVSRISFWKKGPIKDKKLEKFLHEKWLREQRPSDHKRPVQDLDVLRFLEKHGVDPDQLQRQFNAQGSNFKFGGVELDKEMINKFRSGLVVDNLLRKNKFNPDDENHMIMFLQKHGHTGKELLASDLKNLGVAKDKIPGLLERAASYLSTYTSLQALKTSGSLSKDRLFYKMNEHKVSPDELQVLLDVDKSFTVSGNMITRAFVDEYKRYVKNLK